jgi:hypothetical protein
MIPDEARKRITGDGWHARVEEWLRRTEDLIDQSRARIAEHAVQMERTDRNSPRLYAVSRDLHRNLEEGLQLLMHHRDMLVGELQYIERRLDVETGRYYKI